jgi:hypothetical protein
MVSKGDYPQIALFQVSEKIIIYSDILQVIFQLYYMVILFHLLYPNLLYIQIYDIVLFQYICIRSPLLLVHTAALLLVKWTYFWVMAYSEHHLYCCGRSLLVPLAVPHEAVVSHSVQFLFSLPRKFFPACLCNENHTTKYPIGSMYAIYGNMDSINIPQSC